MFRGRMLPMLDEQKPVGTENAPEVKIEKSKKQSTWELLRFGLIALIAVLGIRTFVVQPFIVSGSSMVPTFEDGQYLIIDEISYNLSKPQRDDVIVFKYPKDPSKFFIKRIIGLPNETVDIKNGEIIITNADNKEGFKLEEPYVKNITNGNTHFELKDGEYFVMGDNRPNSSDSRYWGALNENLVVGKVLLRLWPINKADLLPGNYKSTK
ncbi:MAG: signal peptidase I [Candidatus Pacebacteria bacterium]|nr:signal peptidase I [Candidatus Paceibacterota bacterium]